MEWLNRLGKAIDYLENNLEQEISYDEAAKIAHCSTYYFQRMFSYVAGIPLSEYIRRRRMTQAAFDLQSTDARVLDIAIKYGYNSPTAFNRAFQSIHGIAPVSAKSQGKILNAYPPIKFIIKITGGRAMEYKIEEKQAIRVVGARVPLVKNIEENMLQIPRFWEECCQKRLTPKIIQLIEKEPYGLLGVAVYQEPDNCYYYIAAATEQPVPQGMFECHIPASTRVIFTKSDLTAEELKPTVQNIFKTFMTEWLPSSGYSYAELPDIEVYQYDETTDKHSLEVWIAIKK